MLRECLPRILSPAADIALFSPRSDSYGACMRTMSYGPREDEDFGVSRGLRSLLIAVACSSPASRSWGSLRTTSCWCTAPFAPCARSSKGPAGLIEALSRSIGPRGTLVMPSWTGDDDRPFGSRGDPGFSLSRLRRRHLLATPLGATRSPSVRLRGKRAEGGMEIFSDPLVLPPHQSRQPGGQGPGLRRQDPVARRRPRCQHHPASRRAAGWWCPTEARSTGQGIVTTNRRGSTTSRTTTAASSSSWRTPVAEGARRSSPKAPVGNTPWQN